MKKSNMQKTILAAFLDEGMLFPNALKTITEEEKYLSNTLSKLTNEGYIGNRKSSVKVLNRKYTVTYKVICPKGLQWLVDNCADEYPWLKYIPNPIPKFSLRQISNSEYLNRFLKSITASTIFKNFGIKTAHSKEIDRTKVTKSVSYQEMIRTAQEHYEQDKIQHGNKTETYQNIKSKDIYYHSRDISKIFKLNPQEVQQHIFSSHIGLLISRGKSYFIYATTPRGIKFKSGAVERARISVSHFLFSNNITDEQYNAVQKGIIFCKNSKEFEMAFKSNWEKKGRAGMERLEPLNRMFRGLHILPVCRESMYTLDDILTYSDEVHLRTIAELIKTDRHFIKSNNNIFELQYQNHEVYIGIDMDLVKLQSFYGEILSESNKDKTYILICYEWQKEYYERLMPKNVEYYTVPIGFLP